MTERKWTPGPWDAMATGWIEAGDGDPIALINDSGLPNSIFDEDLPNAHLIAAAPDLYEALEWLSDAVLALGRLDDSGHILNAINKADVALAKARGET